MNGPSSRERRALLLSGRMGKGHDTVALACGAALARHGFESKVLDSIELLGSGGGAIGDRVFKTLFSSAAVYDAFHFSQLRSGGRVARWLDDTALHWMYPRFREQVDTVEPELIVSVFATGAAAAARLKREERPDVVTVVFMTDSFAHRMWVHEGTDLFLVTSAMAAASVRRFRPRADVAIVAAPVRPGFYRAPSRPVAREALGVAADARCVLLMSGAWGVGPVDAAAEALARAGFDVLAVAGTNRKLEERLRRLAATHPTLHPFGYTERVPELMAASDIVVTSAGDTCTEARVVGRGLVLLDVVPGHGRENVMHELELGGAAVCSPTPESVVESVEAFLDDAPRALSPPATPDQWESDFEAALTSVGVELA